MESQVLGFQSTSHSKIACAAVAALLLSAPASFAASTHHRVHAGVPYERAQPSSRAQYGAFPGSVDRPNECIGGYRYMRHIYDANRTPAEDLVPLPATDRVGDR
jgi:hypothetical protein